MAWERYLESQRDDAMFHDPFAKALAGANGASLSDHFGSHFCQIFDMAGWEEFHKVWAAVRTKYIDDQINKLAGTGVFTQIVNLGAGCDTRQYRLQCYETFSNGNYDVDMHAVNAGKKQVFEKLLNNPTPKCKTCNTDLDFLDESTSLHEQLTTTTAFNPAAPSVILSEGCIAYLGTGNVKFLDDLTAIAAPGSALILQFNDFSDCPDITSSQDHIKNSLSHAKAEQELTRLGWVNLHFSKFGEDELNFGRFPTDRFTPKACFSFVVGTKAA